MRPPTLPDDEAERLRALRLLRVLDSPAEERFDRLTRLARAMFRVPIALISLVDEDRQWFKSRQGLEAFETPRDVSFCAHAILESDVLHVPNALEDPRFASNPLVTGPPHIRFYAGVPLATREGHRVGTLCLIDDQPRELTDDERHSLLDLAACVREELVKAELVEAKEQAEKSNLLKSEFLNMMSHELRTPLTVVLGYLPLLKDPKKMPAPQMIATMANDMRAAGDHLLQLINDLLDLSKIEADKLELQRQSTGLAGVVDEVFGQLQMKADAKGLALESSVGDVTIDADPLRLRQILINLVGNAVKFTERGDISVAAREVADGVELRVTDTGVGIPRADLPTVFDRFRQVDGSSTRKIGGTGLGLAITRRLVELHGGTIDVESRPGEGSVFTVHFRNPSAR